LFGEESLPPAQAAAVKSADRNIMEMLVVLEFMAVLLWKSARWLEELDVIDFLHSPSTSRSCGRRATAQQPRDRSTALLGRPGGSRPSPEKGRKPVMPKFAVHVAAAVLALAAALFACQGKGAQSAESQSVPSTGPEAGTSPSATKSLAEGYPPLDEHGPKMDLVASRALWHLYRQGLFLPFASEGFRKYDQQYSRPWRGVVDLDGHKGRSLGSTAATLHFPWSQSIGEATLLVRVHGDSARKKLSLRLNGKPLKAPSLGSGWQEVAVAVPGQALVQGENTLVLTAGKKGAVFHSLEMVPGRAPVSEEAWPSPSPAAKVLISGQERECLTGFSRMTMPVEIPEGARLVVGTNTGGSRARLHIAVAVEGKPTELVQNEVQEANTLRERRISLAGFAGKLVALTFAVAEGRANDVAWLSPRILLPRTEVKPRPEPSRNIIMFVADALRADRLSTYAKTRVATPNLTKAAESEGVIFTATQAASPSSPPSHASIQSGSMPRSHGILGDKSKVRPGSPMISAIVAKHGIATAFVGDAPFAMNRLKPASAWTEFHQPSAEHKGGDCSAVVKLILEFADKQAGKRFFVSAVAFEAHTPYFYHQGTTEHYYDGPFDEAIGKRPDGVVLTDIVKGRLKMTPERWDQLRGLYDGEVEHLDGCFGTLLDGLKSRGLAENTPIVFLADHGEGFFEHGGMGHAFGQYAELTNVPLIFFLPGLGHGEKIATVVSHIDVVPTIVDLMGLPADERVQGESLLPMILRQGQWVPRVMPSEYGRSYALRSRAWHYIVNYSGRESLYNIALDPTEKTDLKDKEPLALRYFRDLAGIYLAHRAAWRTRTWGTLNNHAPGFVAATGE